MKVNNGKIIRPLLFAAALIPIAVVASILVAFYSLESYTPDMTELILSQTGSIGGLVAVTAVQGALYAAFCGFFGYILSDKIGLMGPLGFKKAALVPVSVITLICGVLFAGDYFVFGGLLPELNNYYADGISAVNLFASLLYGGIIEEIMLRLFLMSLIAFVIWKIFARSKAKKDIPLWIFVASNVIAALLFAAGHLPATVSMFGQLSPMIVFRCFLLNGGLGLVFGYFYRKYGIQYAILGHFGCHLVSKLLLIVLL